MANTTISINLTESEFSQNDKNLVAECLNLKKDELEKRLSELAKTAFIEYLKMFTKDGLPTKADEILQERLFFLIIHFYQDTLPNEDEIASIFKLTIQRSISLLRNTLVKNWELRSQLNRALGKVVKSAEKTKDLYFMTIQSKIILEELKKIITQNGPNLEQLSKVRGQTCLYKCPPDTYELLKRKLKNE